MSEKPRSEARVVALKYVDGNDGRVLVHCDADDKDAVLFRVDRLPGMLSTETLDFEREVRSPRYRAEQVAYAVARAYEAGRRAGVKQVRDLILNGE